LADFQRHLEKPFGAAMDHIGVPRYRKSGENYLANGQNFPQHLPQHPLRVTVVRRLGSHFTRHSEDHVVDDELAKALNWMVADSKSEFCSRILEYVALRIQHKLMLNFYINDSYVPFGEVLVN
jgi:hypothetical protein